MLKSNYKVIMRTGLIAKKVGMSRVFTESGVNTPVTILQLDNSTVLHQRTLEKDGYNAVMVSFGKKKKVKLLSVHKVFLLR